MTDSAPSSPALELPLGALHRELGAHVDAEGFLHEPFWLLPMGWFFAFGGLAFLVASLFRAKK